MTRNITAQELSVAYAQFLEGHEFFRNLPNACGTRNAIVGEVIAQNSRLLDAPAITTELLEKLHESVEEEIRLTQASEKKMPPYDPKNEPTTQVYYIGPTGNSKSKKSGKGRGGESS